MDKSEEKRRILSVVFGSHFNSYSILQELQSQNVEDIVLIYSHAGLASYSNIPVEKIKVQGDFDSYYYVLLNLGSRYEKLILFPSDDLHIEFFYRYYDQLLEFCYIPLNPDTYQYSIEKFNQYKACEELSIPYPKSILVNSEEDIEGISGIEFPMIIKPLQREDLKIDLFRNIVLHTKDEWNKNLNRIVEVLKGGVKLIISEIIPGDTNGTIYAYCGFRSPLGSHKILNQWTGKKLSQHPDDYGVFSSASNEAPEEVRQYGEKLIEKLNLYGFIEPEFKYDERDGKYKLMEINLRPMMWNRMGYLSGVKLHYTAWLDANEMGIEKYEQDDSRIVHFYYLRHELNNLKRRQGYWKVFRYNLFGGDKNVMAIFNFKDIKPFLFDLLVLLKNLFKK